MKELLSLQSSLVKTINGAVSLSQEDKLRAYQEIKRAEVLFQELQNKIWFEMIKERSDGKV